MSGRINAKMEIGKAQIVLSIIILMFCWVSWADGKDKKAAGKSILDQAIGLIPKVGGPVSKSRTIGQGMNDMAIPGRKEFENFDRNDPGFQAWLKRKEEQRQKAEKEKKQREEAIKNYSTFGGMQKTMVPEHAQGTNQLNEIIKAPPQNAPGKKPPAGTMNAIRKENTSAQTKEKQTVKENSSVGKKDFLGDLLKQRETKP